RLNVVAIETKPLRERVEDIVPLAEIMLQKYALEYNKPLAEITPTALKLLQRHSWPGNVREFENVIQRLIILSGRRIDVEDLPEYLKYDAPLGQPTLQPLKEVEK